MQIIDKKNGMFCGNMLVGSIPTESQKLVDIFFPEFISKNLALLDQVESNITKTSFQTEKKLHLCQHSKNCSICKATKYHNDAGTVRFLIDAHERVKQSGKPNFLGCKIKVNNRMNFEYMRSLLVNYKDREICDLLEFGFPLGCQENETLLNDIHKKDRWKNRNHKGAEDFPEQMVSYLEKESKCNAILGPFHSNPFQTGLKISPLNTVPKKDTTERRVILDLSFPPGSAVNNFISKDEYLGEKIDLVYPKVDDFIELIKAKGSGCHLYKVDLRKAFRQINICPGQYNLVSFIWKKHIFCDTVLSMGARSAAYCCQRMTNAFAFIMFQIGICLLNYLDDLASAETPELAHFSFNTVRSVLRKCGIEESQNKACPPSTIMAFIGVLFNTNTMTIEVTPERLNEIICLLRSWLDKTTASLREIQSLLGKLNFIAACVRPGRIFISRMLKWLKSLNKETSNRHQQVEIPMYVKKDVLWWYRFLPVYNGVSLMLYEEWCLPDEICSSDSCLHGCGGFWLGKYFHVSFPTKFKEKNFHITILEMFAVVICLKLWGSNFKGMKIQMFC